MGPEKLAHRIVENSLKSYADYEDISVSQSIGDLSRIHNLAGAVNQLAEALLENLVDKDVRKSVRLARVETQTFVGTEYVDLYDFCDLLRQDCVSVNIQAACQQVMSAISPDGAVLKSVYQGSLAQYTYGLSIYFPQSEVSRFYEQLDFARDTRWCEFLKPYVRTTRRPNRGSAAS